MIMNSQVRKDDFSTTFKPYIDVFTEVGYRSLNNDALWKWSSILWSLDQFPISKDDICVDIGGGMSPLTKIISNTCKIINVDKYRGGNWFPLNENGEFINSTGLNSNPKNIEYVDADFFDWANSAQDESADFMYDSCSVIHFNVKHDYSMNDGCFETLKQVERILKPGGIFIVASDLLHPIHKDSIPIEDNKGEFLYYENMMRLYSRGKLFPVGGIGLNLEQDFYTNILEVDPSLANFHKLNNLFYQGKEDWQTFCHYEGSCLSNLSIGRFVFRKEA